MTRREYVMKRTTIITILVIVSLNSFCIEPILVKFRCNLKTLNKQEGDNREAWTLSDPICGWCYVFKSKHPNELVGHEGFLIYKNSYDMGIRVYDLRCPECDSKGATSQIRMDSSVDAICSKCGIRYDVCNIGSSMISLSMKCLEGYTYYLEGDSLFIDSSPGLEQRRRLWKSSR